MFASAVCRLVGKLRSPLVGNTPLRSLLAPRPLDFVQSFLAQPLFHTEHLPATNVAPINASTYFDDLLHDTFARTEVFFFFFNCMAGSVKA